ncbi:MAG TPA: hypothetical protein VNK89_09790 [Thermoflexus sp.]|nr:hypothetical protein [Thermoflexus sp.]
MNQHRRPILVEGYADQTLVQALGIPPKRIRREKNKGNICNRLRRSKDEIAIMDEDPQSPQPRYLNQLEEIQLEEGEEDFGIRVLRDPERNHWILLLCPNLEGWILRVAGRNRVSIQQLELPNQADELHRAWPGNLPKLEQLVQELRARGSPELEFLRRYLR